MQKRKEKKRKLPKNRSKSASVLWRLGHPVVPPKRGGSAPYKRKKHKEIKQYETIT